MSRKSTDFLIGLESVQIHNMYNFLHDEQYTACIVYSMSYRYTLLLEVLYSFGGKRYLRFKLAVLLI
jgi:hypothetical protein